MVMQAVRGDFCEVRRRGLAVGAFVIAGIVEPDGEAFQRGGRMARRKGRHDGGIKSPGQEDAQRHIGDQTAFYGPGKQTVHADAGVLIGHRLRFDLILRAPVDFAGPAGFQLKFDRGPRTQFIHTLADRGGCRNVLERQVVGECRKRNRGRAARTKCQRRKPAGESEFPGRKVEIVQRLHAMVITRQQKRLFLRIIKGKREEAVEARKAVRTLADQEFQQNFRVGSRAEDFARLLQFGAEFAEVEDFAVEDERVTTIAAVHGLRAAVEVDHGETGVGKPERTVQIHPARVRSPLAHRAAEALQERLIRRRLRIETACDPAHKSFSPMAQIT